MSNTGYELAGTENLLQETFLPHLLVRKLKSLTSLIETQTTIPVKKSSLGLQNFILSMEENYLIPRRTSMELIWSVTGRGKLSTTNHPLEIREERRDRQKIWDDANNAKLKEIVDIIKATDCRLIIRARNTGSWLTIRGTIDGNYWVIKLFSPW